MTARKNVTGLREERAGHGGDRLAAIEREVARTQAERDDRRRRLATVEADLARLGLPAVDDLTGRFGSPDARSTSGGAGSGRHRAPGTTARPPSAPTSWRRLHRTPTTYSSSRTRSRSSRCRTLPDTVAVWGKGYSLDGLRSQAWFADRQVKYAGDLDTHGFAILDRLRGWQAMTSTGAASGRPTTSSTATSWGPKASSARRRGPEAARDRLSPDGAMPGADG